jgi:UDP-N-acetylmuramoylalanine--D-glutamate ligase
MLNGLGQRCKLFGNIGVPISITAGQNVDYLVLEVSSYQAADMDGYCDVALLTSLFPEHLDWHGSVNNYYESKINLLNRANFKIVSDQAMVLAMEAGLRDSKLVSVQLNQPKLFENLRELGNEYLSRPQNLSNVAMALEVIKHFNFDPQLALEAVKNFTGLPHRQRILGERDGIQYVDDSISTTPNSTIAALEVFKGRPLSLIAGGYDRGISYDLLVDYLKKHRVEAVVCLGDSGARIAGLLKDSDNQCVRTANSMEEAVKIAKTLTPVGGTVLLSPSAPSYGLFSNFIERGLAFAAAAGF